MTASKDERAGFWGVTTPKQVVKGTGEEAFTMAMMNAMTGRSPSDAILDQEASGQRSLVNSEQLPVDGSPGDRCSEEYEEAWLGTGIEFGPSVEGELFRNALLPDDWKLKATDHSMHSELLDDKGRVRASIFYKAAFYDRSARVSIQRRFYVEEVFGDGSFEDAKDVTYQVTDAQAQVFRSAPRHVPGFPGHDDMKKFEEWKSSQNAAETEGKEECIQWLVGKGYPEWEHPARYW